MLRCRRRARCRSRSASPRWRCSRVGALAVAVHRPRRAARPALRMLLLGGLAGAVTFAIGRLLGVSAWLTAKSRVLASRCKPGATSRCGSGIRGSFPARSPRSTARPPAARPSRCCAADGAFLAQRRLFAASQIRARVWTLRCARARSTTHSSRAASRARSRRARRCSTPRTPDAGWSTANRTGCPAWSPIATATSSSLQLHVGRRRSAGATRSSRRSSTRPAARASTSAPTPTCARSKACRRAPASRTARCRTRVTLRRGRPRYGVDVVAGQKTGFYLDQRDESRVACARSPRGARCSTAFCYTGGFTLAALAGGARSVARRSTARPTRWRSRARTSRAIRRSTADRARVARGRRVRRIAQAARPRRALRPDRARSAEVRADRARTAERAARAYKDINLLALKLLRPGGLLATFSCSGGIDAELFQQDRRRRRAGRRRRMRRSSDALRRAPIIRSRSPFPKATI